MTLDTTELTDADWVERVAERMLSLDRSLTGEEVHRIASAIVSRARWRALSPEAAADKAFDDPEAAEGI